MKIKVVLPGSIRSKKNSKRIYGRGKYKIVLPSIAYTKWEEDVRAEVVDQEPWMFARWDEAGHNPASVNAQIYYKGQQPDLSGCFESIGDAMEGYLWANDKQIISWDGSRLHHDKKNPRTEITVEYADT